jgi:methylated-DNA-[protein]-cysteine S-methyltransferase
MKYGRMESPVGPLTIAADVDGLLAIRFRQEEIPSEISCENRLDAGGDIVRETIGQLQAYFAKKLVQFNLPLKPKGTPFQMEVWRELQRIPYGTVISYGELAARIGMPQAARAVGAANGANPIPIVIPCHRVIGGNGKMTGYGGGIQMKEALLALEQVRLF